ncbi:MAG: type II/IV secretion system protein [Planctomycetaceae bacterium]|nr:type II/IV secretion system protein [Planctomycetaceae bacterium]
MAEQTAASPRHIEVRQKALQQELLQLLDVVGPGQIVDLLLERSFQLRATDIHFDPSEQGLRVRLRVDGMLHDVLQVDHEQALPMISRLKLMAEMDITERRLAQDGHITRQFLDQQRDVRVGSVPTALGERLVLRLMPDSGALCHLDQLGLDSQQVSQLKRYISSPYGMILSAGPVGCGKTTTMYNCLDLLNESTRSLVTIEDPIERRVPGVNQIQIEPRFGFGFVEALRGVLRQDPNVVMIGEIRDPETAHIGVRAARTGVLVLSTIHANDAASSFDMFRDFGIPSMFIADSLHAVVAQRLLRKVCTHCKQTFVADEPTRHVLHAAGAPEGDLQLSRGAGCDACFQTGYLGRTGVFEIIGVEDDLKHALIAGASRGELVRIARARGMQSLQAAAARRVVDGTTSIEEMHRVLLSDPVSGERGA